MSRRLIDGFIARVQALSGVIDGLAVCDDPDQKSVIIEYHIVSVRPIQVFKDRSYIDYTEIVCSGPQMLDVMAVHESVRLIEVVSKGAMAAALHALPQTSEVNKC